MVGELGHSVLQSSSVVVAPVSGVSPGIEGAEQGGVGQLGYGLLQGCPVMVLAVAGATPCLEDLYNIILLGTRMGSEVLCYC